MKRKRLFQIIGFCLLFSLYSCGGNAFESLADESSQEACRYEVTRNLDSGNWDAVISSSCADSMQKGAAYLGRAGFDIKDVINRLSEAKDEENELDIYLKALVPKVTENTLTDLLNAKNEYSRIPESDYHYKDAQFYISLVETSYSLSLMKIVIDSDGDGAISSTCDINGNGVPDDADAVSCALMASAGENCGSWASYTATGDITFEGKNGTYRGLTITINGSSSGTCPTEYKKLLYKDDGNYWLATTTSETCRASDNNDWPCPVEMDNNPLDFVTAIDDSLDKAIEFLDNALPGLDEDVTQAIREIRDKACGGNRCTSQEIADYIQRYLTTK